MGRDTKRGAGGDSRRRTRPAADILSTRHPVVPPPEPTMPDDFQVVGQNPAALFTLKLHRGDGMALVAMNWKAGPPPNDFVGFAIEYKEPGGQKYYPLKNRIAFPG